MNSEIQNLKIFTANSNINLAKSIAKNLNLELGKADVKTFSDGEISISISESVRGQDCYVVQSTCEPVNSNLMELLIMIDALKRAAAKTITAVMPYFGYARQDRKVKPRDPISAKLVADLISTAGANKILTMDLHAQQIQGFFNIPVDHLFGTSILVSYIKNSTNFNPEDFVVLAPDLGSIARARQFSKKLGCPLVLIDKRRPQANVSQVMNIIGDAKGKKVILVDDMIDTAGTICNAADAILQKGGAKEVYVYATHAVLSGPAIERLQNSAIKSIVFLDTIPIAAEKLIDKIQVLSVSAVFAETIKRLHLNLPISSITS